MVQQLWLDELIYSILLVAFTSPTYKRYTVRYSYDPVVWARFRQVAVHTTQFWNNISEALCQIEVGA
jgi:hypothetical protein